MSLTYQEIPRLISCRLHPTDAAGIMGTLCIDSRKLNAGDVFIALKTERADGHDYVAEAIAKGAQAAFVERGWFENNKKLLPKGKFIIVEDTLFALQQLAKAHRSRFHVPVIALTGSNGKTSTKELIAAALGTQYEVIKSPGNFNNHIGIPLTLLQIEPGTEMVLLEMGANQPGDIALLCSLAQPDFGLVLNVGPAHLQKFDNLQGVAREKAQLLLSLPPSGAAFVNCDDEYVNQMETTASHRLCYGYRIDAAALECHRMYCAENLGLTREGFGAFRLRNTTFKMNWYGIHQISNGLAATAVADFFGIPLEDIARKFSSMPPIEGRLDLEIIAGITVIDDSYNANFASTVQALELLQALHVTGKKYVVLGDHLELGKSSAEEHRKLGRLLGQKQLDGVFLIGPEMQNACEAVGDLLLLHTDDYQNLQPSIEKILNKLKSGDALLVKGSRGMGLDRLVKEMHNSSIGVTS